MRAKLRGQLNMGVDPEMLAIGAEMAVYHIEKGARAFSEYAKGMIADLGDMNESFSSAKMPMNNVMAFVVVACIVMALSFLFAFPVAVVVISTLSFLD